MMNEPPCAPIIKKFGGSVITSPKSFHEIAKKIVEDPARQVIVVSAMRGMTDELLGLAHKVHEDPPKREVDMLISVGERISISLLAMALAAKGVEAVSFTGSQMGIMTTNEHRNAKILEVRPKRVHEALLKGQVVIAAGFQGMSFDREITTLGRGGSDTTAVALGAALNAEAIHFYKDVGGIFSEDPSKSPEAEHHTHLDYDQALEVVQRTGEILHPEALVLAKKKGLPLQILSMQSWNDCTHIGHRRGSESY